MLWASTEHAFFGADLEVSTRRRLHTRILRDLDTEFEGTKGVPRHVDVIALILSFWLLPGLVATLTPLRYARSCERSTDH